MSASSSRRAAGLVRDLLIVLLDGEVIPVEARLSICISCAAKLLAVNVDNKSSISVSFLAILDGVLASKSSVLNDSINSNIFGSSKSKRLLVCLEEPLDEGLDNILVGARDKPLDEGLDNILVGARDKPQDEGPCDLLDEGPCDLLDGGLYDLDR